MIVGNSWYNNGIEKYVGEMGLEASTPQIILTYKKYSEVKRINIVDEKMIINLKGEKQILNWFDNSVPLPVKFLNEIKNKKS